MAKKKKRLVRRKTKTSNKEKTKTKAKSKPALKTKAKIKSKEASLKRKTDFPWKTKKGENLLVRRPITSKSRPKYYRRSADLVKCKDLNDSELIIVIQKQNRQVYKELFSRYQKKLFTYIFHLIGNRDETEDILQNVFSKTYKNIKNFDTDRKFSSWIYRIAHNEAVNFLKRKSKRYTVSWEDITSSKDKLDTAANDEMPEEKWMQQEINKEMHQALSKLSKKYRQILELRYFKELSYEDISTMLDKPVNTVGTLINRAKKKLLDVVKDQKVEK